MTNHAGEPWGTAAWLDNRTFLTRQYTASGAPYGTDAYSTDSFRYVRKTRSPEANGLIVNGWRQPLPAAATIVTLDRDLCTYTQWANSSPTSLRTVRWQLPTLSTFYFDVNEQGPSFANLAAKADTEALQKLRDQKMELGVSLLEARRSVNHLSSTFTRLARAIIAAKKGRFGTVAEILGIKFSRKSTRNLASHWLEYQYAWRPLIWDVSAAYEIAQQGLIPPLTMRAERNVKSTAPIVIRTWKANGANYNAIHKQSTLTDETVLVDAGVRTILYTRVDSAALQRMGNLGLINPAEIAWELVPFSFVVDWFVPVGTFLSACTARFGQTFVSGTRTRWMSKDISRTGMSGSYHYRPESVEEGTLEWKGFTYAREALSTFPTPKLFGNYSLSTNKVVTAVALWRQLRR